MRGNIRQRAKDSWTITIELPKDCLNNKRKQKYYTFRGTKKEADVFLTEKLRELDTGLLIDTKDIRFGEYLDYWLNERCLNRLKITTIENYKRSINNHIKVSLGNINLQKLMPLHLQNFYKQCIEKGLSNKSILNYHMIIHCALERAVKWQILIRNVADNVEPPKPQRYQAKFLDEKQTKLLLEKAKTSEIYIPVVVTIYTGMRRGEVLGLTWDNINFENGNISISKALINTSEGLKYLSPKTQQSVRNVSIPETLVKILKKHRTDQLINKMKYGEQYINNNAVCTYENGKIFNPKRFSHMFNDLLKDNGLPLIRFHDLRHSHASLLVKFGIQPKIISDRLGHSNIGITMDFYSHIYEDTHKEVAEIFDKKINFM